MIISRTPLRVSFAGGGTDMRDYYQSGFGAVTASAIKQYMYVTVNKRFENSIRVSYSKTEIVSSLDALEHGIVRESLRKVGIRSGIEVSTIADIPSKGTGLGSSSALTVGLLNALYAFKGNRASPKTLAEQACEIEIEILGGPIGKQDQYIAAYGGLQHFRFNADETVFIDPVICPTNTKREIERHLMLFFTGRSRNARDILSVQKKNAKTKMETLNVMRDQAIRLYEHLVALRVNEIGGVLKDGWELKKSLADGISDTELDALMDKAIAAGATGGKITGAGGGGFLLLFVPPAEHWRVRDALSGFKEVEFRIEPQGSRIIYVGDEM